ncbi:MAG: alpha/beta fold hydrolase, partial [Hyphomicrobiales bacterium]
MGNAAANGIGHFGHFIEGGPDLRIITTLGIAGGYDHEFVEPVGVPKRKLDRDLAAEGIAHDAGLLDATIIEHGGDVIGGLLHGGVNPSAFFGAPLAEMAKNFEVIAIHARGHGFSRDTDAPWTLEQAADDVAAVLKSLGIEKASVMGYSFGGKIAQQFALSHPQMLDKLVVIAAAFAKAGEYSEVRAAFEKMLDMADTVGAGIAQSPLGQL